MPETHIQPLNPTELPADPTTQTPPTRSFFQKAFHSFSRPSKRNSTLLIALFGLLAALVSLTAIASQHLSFSVQAAGLPNSISLKVGDKGSVQCPAGELIITWKTSGPKKIATIACLPLPKPSPRPTPAPTKSPTPSTSPMPSGMVMPTPTASATPVPNGSAPSGGLGVGTDGQEVGLNLTKFKQLTADAAKGVYDRPCTAAEHDNTKWHSLVNVEAKCHYDHEHGDDPNYVNDLFGEPGAWFNKPGQSVSYPWQTFTLPATTTEAEALAMTGTEGQKENDLKHEGYYWVVRRNQTCDEGAYCITDFRLQFHFMSSHHNEVGSRFHSFSFEGRLCKDPKDQSTCGIYRTGGWQDHGQLVITNDTTSDCWGTINAIKEGKPANGKIIGVPNDGQYFPLNSQGLTDELRCHKNISEAIVKSMPNGMERPVAEWWTHGAADFRYVIRVFDPISNVDPTNPTGVTPANQPFCKQDDPTCRWNNSIITAGQGYTTQLYKDYDQTFSDEDENGRTDLTVGKLYINRFGNVNRSCKTAGLDCIPLVLDNVFLSPTKDSQRYSNKQCENCIKVDHDLTPKNIPSWIQWFYKKM